MKNVSNGQIVREAVRELELDKDVYSTGELAAICGVTKHTIIAAVEKGSLRASQTPGGHNRIRREDALEFMKRYNYLPEQERRKWKILVACEEDFLAELLEQILDQEECEVLYAADAYDTALAVDREKPDLVILDLQSAGLSCRKVCGHVGESKFGKTSRVIAVTDRKKATAMQRREAKMADAVLEKPFRIQDLQSLVKEMLKI